MSRAPSDPNDDVPAIVGAGQSSIAFRADDLIDVHGPTVAIGWSAIGLIELTSYGTLRRRLGKARAECLAAEIGVVIARIRPDMLTDIAARDRIELRFEVAAIDELPQIAAAIHATFDRPVDIAGEPFRIDIRIAIAAAEHGAAEDVRLAEEVEAAIAEAAIGAPVIRDLSSDAPAFDRATLVRELPAAIVRGQMCLQYQPKVDVRQQRIASAEALIRWDHPTRGLILPAEFITLAEEVGVILPLTLWTLDRAIADQLILAAAGYDLEIFINISAVLLADAEFVRLACRKVADAGARIGFEITETAVIRDPESAIHHLGCFAEHGISIAIDDYGAGLSSLAYLKRLPATELKIDKMFVMQLTSSNRDPLIVRSTIDLAHALDMRVTAEGVETQAALALLSVMGCDMVQGYLLSRPLPFDAFRRFIESGFAELVEESEQRALRRPASFWKGV